MILAIDLVRFCREILKRLSECDVRIDDYKYIEICDEYCRMVERVVEAAVNYLDDTDNPYGTEKIWSYLNS